MHILLTAMRSEDLNLDEPWMYALALLLFCASTLLSLVALVRSFTQKKDRGCWCAVVAIALCSYPLWFSGTLYQVDVIESWDSQQTAPPALWKAMRIASLPVVISLLVLLKRGLRSFVVSH